MIHVSSLGRKYNTTVLPSRSRHLPGRRASPDGNVRWSTPLCIRYTPEIFDAAPRVDRRRGVNAQGRGGQNRPKTCRRRQGNDTCTHDTRAFRSVRRRHSAIKRHTQRSNLQPQTPRPRTSSCAMVYDAEQRASTSRWGHGYRSSEPLQNAYSTAGAQPTAGHRIHGSTTEHAQYYPPHRAKGGWTGATKHPVP